MIPRSEETESCARGTDSRTRHDKLKHAGLVLQLGVVLLNITVLTVQSLLFRALVNRGAQMHTALRSPAENKF